MAPHVLLDLCLCNVTFLFSRFFADLKKSPLFGNGYQYPPHLAHIPFMPIGHPAIMNFAMANHLGLRHQELLNMAERNQTATDLSSPRYVANCSHLILLVCYSITCFGLGFVQKVEQKGLQTFTYISKQPVDLRGDAESYLITLSWFVVPSQCWMHCVCYIHYDIISKPVHTNAALHIPPILLPSSIIYIYYYYQTSYFCHRTSNIL